MEAAMNTEGFTVSLPAPLQVPFSRNILLCRMKIPAVCRTSQGPSHKEASEELPKREDKTWLEECAPQAWWLSRPLSEGHLLS